MARCLGRNQKIRDRMDKTRIIFSALKMEKLAEKKRVG
jgi:hypothetical protein